MNRARKARLAAGGWRIGSADDFLGLSKEEAAFVEMKLALAPACASSESVATSLRPVWPNW